MKKLAAVATWGSILLVALGFLTFGEERKSPAASGQAPTEYLLDEINSLSRALFQLAAERYSVHSDKNETWILTVHQGNTLRKYTDKKYTLLSLPIFQPTDKISMCRYASQYNELDIMAADRMVKAGNYQEARHLYKLILYFNRCGDELLEERIHKKLELLDKLEIGGNVDVNLKRFTELSEDLAPLVDFSPIEKMSTTVVTDLFQVKLP